MCGIPGLHSVVRESYNQPEAVYARLKEMGMDLVTITDHDSIDAVESLRRHPDFFLSEEVTCRMPDGTQVHLGVYDIADRDHVEIQKRASDFLSLVAYLRERRILFSANHVFSSLTGPRRLADFDWLTTFVPAFETQNGLMPAANNKQARRLAKWNRKIAIGGSDAHALASVGNAWTQVSGAQSKREFFDGLRTGCARALGADGSYVKLTRDVLTIAACAMKEHPWMLGLAPLMLAVPLVTLGNYCREAAFGRYWMSRLQPAQMTVEMETAA
jgi:predicted metal-dependent phosphoesterase TrpH